MPLRGLYGTRTQTSWFPKSKRNVAPKKILDFIKDTAAVQGSQGDWKEDINGILFCSITSLTLQHNFFVRSTRSCNRCKLQ